MVKNGVVPWKEQISMCPGLRSGSLGTTPACLLTLSPWNQHFCSFCLICFVFCVCLVVQSCLTLFDPMDCSLPVSYISGDSPGRNVGVGCHALLQEIFPTWGSNPGLLNCRQILYQLSHQGSPRILELVAYPFLRGSYQPRNQTGVSCIADGLFTS